jgi:hypothetical protein
MQNEYNSNFLGLILFAKKVKYAGLLLNNSPK